jgi:DNA polymerase III delta prime subunit
MNTLLQNVIKKLSREGNAGAIIISHTDKEQQLLYTEELIRGILKIPMHLKVQANPNVFGIWPENIDGKTIKIDQIHNFMRETQLKPYNSQYKIGVIISAEKMTDEAQNALLKTLEEPPKNTFIILTTQYIRKLLPTILSRSQILEFKNIIKESINTYDIEAILNAHIIKRFRIIEETLSQKDKSKVHEEIEKMIQILLTHFRELLIHSHMKKKTTQILKSIELIEMTKNALDKNVNTRLALENLMINLPFKNELY